ncbi:S8 family peptidase [Mycobacterium sp. E2479]|uniref:S8 family peptidase n=1 Tax=Mycobacterium sp. E2479 TaxID=1834134 RepID=UPI0008021DE7|nr:S8 family peptidase [Mycobacterium sp. E2479]OBH60280.1 peptidase S8 [Mycobacterium sp. E2479]
MKDADIGRWADRVLCAFDMLDSLNKPANLQTLSEAVAARFASQFDKDARLYRDKKPHWQHDVDETVEYLIGRRLVARIRRSKQAAPAAETATLRLTKAGVAQAKEACERASGGDYQVAYMASPAEPPTPKEQLLTGVITPPLREKMKALPWKGQPEPLGVMIELNSRFYAGAQAARERVAALWQMIGATDPPLAVGDQYLTGDLVAGQIESLVSADAAALDWPMRAIFRIWPDFEAHPQIDGSSATIKARAAQRSFESFGDGIVWAVIDSGIQADHPHFSGFATLTDASVADLHRDFTANSDEPSLALVDDNGHGTHVAAIIAGGLQNWQPASGDHKVVVGEKRFNAASPDDAFPIIQPREISDINRLSGMAPHAKLVSLKVLGEGDLAARVGRVMRALTYVRERNAASDKVPRIHGVNLSLGYEFAAEWFACGQSPLCVEVDKVVRSGVVVVAAAGNTGYVTLNPKFADVTRFSAGVTINDPGNAERAITVGSTHRDSPHTFGVSYFSSRGPTGDGRAKPDLVAPGERITSAAAGQNLRNMQDAHLEDLTGAAVYMEDSGTSMAAPHVSGAIAAFLSVQREMIGKPEEVKKIFVESAISLGRERAFQGAGMVDLMRALQSV